MKRSTKGNTVLWAALMYRFDGFKQYRHEITGRSMAWKV